MIVTLKIMAKVIHNSLHKRNPTILTWNHNHFDVPELRLVLDHEASTVERFERLACFLKPEHYQSRGLQCKCWPSCRQSHDRRTTGADRVVS